MSDDANKPKINLVRHPPPASRPPAASTVSAKPQTAAAPPPRLPPRQPAIGQGASASQGKEFLRGAIKGIVVLVVVGAAALLVLYVFFNPRILRKPAQPAVVKSVESGNQGERGKSPDAEKQSVEPAEGAAVKEKKTSENQQGQEQPEQGKDQKARDEDRIKKAITDKLNIKQTAAKSGKTLEEIKSEADAAASKEVERVFPASLKESMLKEATQKFSKNGMPTADQKFTDEMLKKVEEEANSKFKLLEKGDEITYRSRGENRKGKYWGIDGGTVKVGDASMNIIDIPDEVKLRMSPESCKKLASKYVHENYQLAKERYKGQREDEIKEGNEKIKEYMAENFDLKASKLVRDIEAPIYASYGFYFNEETKSWQPLSEYVDANYKYLLSVREKQRMLKKRNLEIESQIPNVQKELVDGQSKIPTIQNDIDKVSTQVEAAKENYRKESSNQQVASTRASSYTANSQTGEVKMTFTNHRKDGSKIDVEGAKNRLSDAQNRLAELKKSHATVVASNKKLQSAISALHEEKEQNEIKIKKGDRVLSQYNNPWNDE